MRGSVGLKICGITHADDLRACRDAGVDAVGLNLWAGSKRYLAPIDAARLVDTVRREGPLPMLVGVVVDPDIDALREWVTAVALDAVQLHGDADPAPYAALGVRWIRVLRGSVDASRLPVVTPPPAWILLDAAVPGFGGQGVRLPWDEAAATARALAPANVWLAGGLDPGNAAEAIARVRPVGLDVASGADRQGDPRRKDPAKIAELATICKNART